MSRKKSSNIFGYTHIKKTHLILFYGNQARLQSQDGNHLGVLEDLDGI